MVKMDVILGVGHQCCSVGYLSNYPSSAIKLRVEREPRTAASNSTSYCFSAGPSDRIDLTLIVEFNAE
jgi:hypothetical protein